MMKYIIVLALPVMLFSCDMKRKDKIYDDAAKQTDEARKDSTTVQIIDSVYNFGKVADGEKVEYNYRFVNSGAKPLVIDRASASCGCTVPEKPEKPIMPGDTGFIKVVFNSSGRVGLVDKNITVISNSKPEFPRLLLTGEVISKP
jgi:hypothetical protein